MKAKLLHEDDGQRTFALVFDTGDSVMDQLKTFAAKEKLAAAQFTGIGAFSAVTLGYFDWEKKDYVGHDYAEQVEVASLTGDVALGPDRKPAIHIHCVLGRSDCSALAGHPSPQEVRRNCRPGFNRPRVFDVRLRLSSVPWRLAATGLVMFVSIPYSSRRARLAPWGSFGLCVKCH